MKTTRKLLALAGLTAGGLAVVAAVFWLAYQPTLEEANRAVIGDSHKAIEINCVNNLKQIGLSFRIWSGDNRDRFPFETPVNEGGSLEWRKLEPNSFDLNSWHHLLVMSNELNSPKVVVCPQDKSRQAATNWASLGPRNVSYWVRSGTNIDETHSDEVLVACPVDGNVVYCDGHVEEHKWKPFPVIP